MAIPAKKDDIRYSYADYLTWSDNERWELIDGTAYSMAPAPTIDHQRILRKLTYIIENFLQDKSCELFFAPIDVRLSENDTNDINIHTVVQPDLIVVCDPSKLDNKGCKGAPDLVVEILSPSTAARDMKEKFFLYEKYGVKEYWLIHPENHVVEIFKLNDQGVYNRAEVYVNDEVVAIGLFPDIKVPLAQIFGL